MAAAKARGAEGKPRATTVTGDQAARRGGKSSRTPLASQEEALLANLLTYTPCRFCLCHLRRAPHLDGPPEALHLAGHARSHRGHRLGDLEGRHSKRHSGKGQRREASKGRRGLKVGGSGGSCRLPLSHPAPLTRSPSLTALAAAEAGFGPTFSAAASRSLNAFPVAAAGRSAGSGTPTLASLSVARSGVG